MQPYPRNIFRRRKNFAENHLSHSSRPPQRPLSFNGHTQPAIYAVGLLCLLILTGCFYRSRGIVVESVNAYPRKNGPSLANSIANGDGFGTWMTYSNEDGRFLQHRLTDGWVYDSDFIDPERTNTLPNRPYANDTRWFDPPNTLASYFTGHGGGNNPAEGCSQSIKQRCMSSTQCVNPNAAAGEMLPGACINAPGFLTFTPPATFQGGCCYNTDRFLYTDSIVDTYGGRVDYSNGFSKWGESEQSGRWAGAGRNGGANLVVLDISHGTRAPFWLQQLQPAAGGVHLIATIMTVNGDTANMATRGSTFARVLLANRNASVANAWAETMNWLPLRSGTPCNGSYENGGGHGINGCGCNLAISFDSTRAKADFHIHHEDVTSLQNDGFDSTDSQFWTMRAMCNYRLINNRFDFP